MATKQEKRKAITRRARALRLHVEGSVAHGTFITFNSHELEALEDMCDFYYESATEEGVDPLHLAAWFTVFCKVLHAQGKEPRYNEAPRIPYLEQKKQEV